MATHMLLSVDLPNHVSSETRDKFNDKLKELHWIKLHHLDTVWRAYYSGAQAVNAAIAEAQRDVKAAALHALIKEYYAVVHVGGEQPAEFKS